MPSKWINANIKRCSFDPILLLHICSGVLTYFSTLMNNKKNILLSFVVAPRHTDLTWFSKTWWLWVSARTVGHKSHDPWFHVFLMGARVMTFVAHCTLTNTKTAPLRAPLFFGLCLKKSSAVREQMQSFVRWKCFPYRICMSRFCHLVFEVNSQVCCAFVSSNETSKLRSKR